MTKREKEMMEMLFGAAAVAAIAEQEAKRQAQTEETATETEAKFNPRLEAVKETKELYDAFIEIGFNPGQATRFVAAILSK